MTQDTRKDRRVKIVSLNVRYKSATVDEFIENHAHDVSRGGIFIKTGNPFPPGTLLKFEIRLASDQAVIAGVGRIVWKRDAGLSDGEHPAGMGVKFIKIDDPSKSVIDRLVNSKSDAGRAFENVREDGSDRPFSRSSPPGRPALASTTPPPAPSGSTRAGVPGSVPPGARPPSVPPEASKSRLQSMPTTSATPFARKSTIMGLGISSHPPGRSSSAPPAGEGATGTGSIPPAARVPFSSAPAAPPRPTSTTAMFPRAHDDGEMPAKEDQTVMRQAAELLEDALREAGGSMADVGQNPLFASSTGIASAQTTTGKPASGSVPAAKPAAGSAADTADSPGPVPVAQSVRREPVSQPASKRDSASPSSRKPVATSTRSPAIAAAAAEPAKKKGSGGAFVLAIVAAAAIAAVVAFRDQLFGRSAPQEPAATPAAPVPTTTAAAATSVATVEVPPAPPPPTAAPAPTPSAAPEPAAASASATPVPAPTRPPQVYVAPRPRPAARPAPTPTVAPPPTQTSEPAATAEPAPVTPAATATTAPESVAPATPAAPPAETTAPSATPAPTTKAKPKGSDDNPY
ncbi:MAG TPA: TIGR02266 family protein [Polyangiaceae bacterium]|jgi:uncharacterized protein (TIGR02266 family)